MQTVFVYSTAASQAEALSIARAVLEQRLAACANIIPAMTSLYWWEGALEQAQEVGIIFKTTQEAAESLTQAIKERHSYQCPCVIVLPINGGNPDYLRWIGQEVRP